MDDGVEPRLVWEGHYLRMWLKGTYECVARTRVSGIVVLVALTGKDELLLVEQYRPPIEGRIVELPAGLAGDTKACDGESVELAAERELLEETGYRVGRLESVGTFEPCAGILSERYTLFLCHDIEQIGEGGGDEHEDILVHHVPVSELETFLLRKRAEGVAIDGKIHAGLWHARAMGMLP